ncbi:hypothetical protein CYMTET_51237 [Cymbomonas tetramitiformis]|uniref:Uncharacterized protein n=1 Tax=Cymbomonas tetramitiformis TaxID=36881 RepID=A0AAE0BLH7_9CHLO|nr:hypothetical protein CYMTET_51237 [Cymbomonas tetramitiformis]
MGFLHRKHLLSSQFAPNVLAVFEYFFYCDVYRLLLLLALGGRTGRDLESSIFEKTTKYSVGVAIPSDRLSGRSRRWYRSHATHTRTS